MKIEIIKGKENLVSDFFSSQINTPKTDKVWNESIKLYDASRLMEMVCHAKNLERDKALEQRNCLHDLHNKNAIRSQELLDLCETLRKERDEADRSLEKEKIALNYIIKRAIETERERDEAREALDQIASLYESKQMTATVDQRITDAYAMRCIARQAIDQLKEGAK